MKIRKLIFSAKLEQIEKQNQNIFIFHCSANASQWRFLKNFLFFYGQRVLANKTSELRTLEGPTKGRADFVVRHGSPLLNYQARSTDSSVASQPSMAADLTDLRRREGGSLLRGYTYFQSTSLKKNPVKAAMQGATIMRGSNSEARPLVAPVFATKKPVHPIPGQNFSRKALVLPRLYAPAKRAGSRPLAQPGSRPNKGAKYTGSHTALSQKSLNKNFRPKGCLFFFDTRSNTLFESHLKIRSGPSLTRLELVNKTLRALELNNNLILLYGQMNSTVVNHVDIKETLILDAQATYQQLFLSMHSLSIGLNFCLHQKIDEFFCIQETNRGLTHQTTV